MQYDINIAEASVYVGTYAKYNNGSIFGKWLDLSDYSDINEFYEACASLHQDEEDPEYMFQDYENIPEGLISECSFSKNFFAVRDALDNMDDSEAFFIWCSNGHHNLSSERVKDLLTSFNEDFIGAYESESEYAEEYVDNVYDLPEWAQPYFDYEKFATNLFCGDYWFSNGYVFRC